LIVTLLPYFVPLTADFDQARSEIIETLESYGARTRAEMINAARIIALSFAALDLLAEARGDEMPYTLRLRACGYANSLERSCQQEERALAKRLAVDPPEVPRPPVEPIDDLPDAALAAAFEQARLQIEDYRASLSDGRTTGAHATPALTGAQHDPSWIGAIGHPVAAPPG
jgi:hypothetical protein